MVKTNAERQKDFRERQRARTVLQRNLDLAEDFYQGGEVWLLERLRKAEANLLDNAERLNNLLRLRMLAVTKDRKATPYQVIAAEAVLAELDRTTTVRLAAY